jgi:hypothetical protein
MKQICYTILCYQHETNLNGGVNVTNVIFLNADLDINDYLANAYLFHLDNGDHGEFKILFGRLSHLLDDCVGKNKKSPNVIRSFLKGDCNYHMIDLPKDIRFSDQARDDYNYVRIQSHKVPSLKLK